MRNSRLLTVLGGRRPYVETFNALSPRLVPLVGTLGVNGGALRAATAGNWLGNIISNGESWEGGPPPTGWSMSSVDAVAVDSAADPGAPSGGGNNTCVKTTVNAVATYPRLAQSYTALVGAMYRHAARAFAPSANTRVNAARIHTALSNGASVTAEDEWQTIAYDEVATVANVAFALRPINTAGASTVGDTAYFDALTVYRQNTAFLVAGWDTPHYVYGLDHISPASGVAPCSAKVRYTDALNYWEVRVLPNTAGNDLQIVQVTAGVETVRAEADVDWTSNDLDQLRVVVEGVVIGLEHRKKGAGSWTDSASWSAATQGLNSPQVGGLLWDTGVNRIAGITLEAR